MPEDDAAPAGMQRRVVAPPTRNEIAVSSLHINQTVAAARITLLPEVMAASTTGRVTTSVSSMYARIVSGNPG